MDREYRYKIIGKMIQNGIDYMEGFNTHADLFYVKWQEVKPQIDQTGNSTEWNLWLDTNKEANINLYEELKQQGLIQ